MSHSFKKPAFRIFLETKYEPLLATIILRVIHQCNLSTNKTMNNWKEYSMMKLIFIAVWIYKCTRQTPRNSANKLLTRPKTRDNHSMFSLQLYCTKSFNSGKSPLVTIQCMYIVCIHWHTLKSCTKLVHRTVSFGVRPNIIIRK